MTFAGSEYYSHLQNKKSESERKPSTDLRKKTIAEFGEIVRNAAQSNGQREADIISRADSQSFYQVHPEFLGTKNNVDLVNHWLKSNGRWGNATFADFEAAFNSYRDSGLLDLDAAEIAATSPGLRPSPAPAASNTRRPTP
jgi:hypothetical protein